MTARDCDLYRTKRIVCFGDSVTQGVPHVAPDDTFTALLDRRLNCRYGPQVQFCARNAGVGGENTAEGLARIQQDVLDHKPDLVTVEFGLNDIRYEPAKRIGQDQFAANLREMHRLITGHGSAIIFMTPTPILGEYHVYSHDTRYYDEWGNCNGLNAVYAEIIRQTAQELEVPLCDIYSAFVQEAVKAEFRGETFDYKDLSVLSRYISSRDGVHPTAAGQELIAAELYAVIVTQNLLVTRI